MSRKRNRRVNLVASQKVSIVREHLLEGVPISDLCDRHGLKPKRFYLLQEPRFERGREAFESPRDSRERQLERKRAKLQNLAREKDEAIAEVAGEMVRLKERRWGSLPGGWVPPDILDEVLDFVTFRSERIRLAPQSASRPGSGSSQAITPTGGGAAGRPTNTTAATP